MEKKKTRKHHMKIKKKENSWGRDPNNSRISTFFFYKRSDLETHEFRDANCYSEIIIPK